MKQTISSSTSLPFEAPSNTFDIGPVQFEAFGDRILVQEDEFKSGYECETCDGVGRIVCPECAGSGAVGTKKFKCSYCEGNGSLVCAECGGKGGILAIPEVSQRRPTSGVVVSIGDKVTRIAVGQAILYSNFTGYVIDLDRAGVPVTIRVLHESEILCKLSGHLQLRTLRNKSEISVGGGN